MATHWIGAGGSDVDTGADYEHRRETLFGGVALLAAKGDILNCVGIVPSSSSTAIVDGDTGMRGTSYDDPGCIIQGTDSAGEPALCSISFTDASRAGITLQDNAAYSIVRGFDLDYSAVTAAVSNTNFVGIVTGSGWFPLRVEYSIIEGSVSCRNYLQAPRLVSATISGTPHATKDEVVEVRYCYLKNSFCHSDNGYRVTTDHCIIKSTDADNYDGDCAVLYTDANTATVSLRLAMTNCTLDFAYTGLQPRAEVIFREYVTGAGGDAYDKALHSNLVMLQSVESLSTSLSFNEGMFANLTTHLTGTVPGGTAGYNYFIRNNKIVELFAAVTVSTYEDVYHPDWPASTTGAELYATDVVVETDDLTTIINEEAAWTWEDVNDSGYDLPLDKDYRVALLAARTAALDGGVVGAIEQPVIGPVVPGEGGDIEFSAVLDSLPFYRPVFKADVSAMVRVLRNKTFSHIDMRHYLKSSRFDESTHRVLEVAAAATSTSAFGGVYASTAFLLETDEEVSVTVTWDDGTDDGASFIATVDESLVFDQAGIRSISITNNGTSTATVQYVAFQ